MNTSLPAEVIGHPERNGLYHVAAATIPSAIRFDAGRWTGKEAMLADLAAALSFPDYFGANWDALEECLLDLSWLDGDIVLLIERIEMPEAHAPQDWSTLLDILADAAHFWREEGRAFSVFLQGGKAPRG